MDQAASVVCNAASALYITFFPRLAATPVLLPPHAVFVIANSLVVSDKAVTAKTNYNLRVVETLVGARILAKRLGVAVGTDEKITLREVLGRLGGEGDKGENELTVEKLVDSLETILKEVEGLKPSNGETGVTLEEMVELSGMSKEHFHRVYLSWVQGELQPISLDN